jgi:FkbM family methyltransferase
MIVNTRRLFTRLLSGLRISAVCDVGSMNGADAVIFREAVPESRIYALEANPENFRLMSSDSALQERNIELVPLAATNYDGEADFFLVEAGDFQSSPRRGMSSLYRRSDPRAPTTSVVRVKTARLDTYLADKCPTDARFALWIDVEGKAYEVIEGLSGVARQVYLLHVEVETSPCISPDQKLYPQVKTLLQRLGFAELATDLARSDSQFNTLFVRRKLPTGMQFRVTALLARACVRYIIGGAIGKLCPACIQRYQLMRLKTSPSNSGLPRPPVR